jgi:hypothetical protein
MSSASIQLTVVAAAPNKRLERKATRDSIFAFEQRLNTSVSIDDTYVPTHNRFAWLLFPTSIILTTALCSAIIVAVPLNDPSDGLAYNISYVVVCIFFLQFLLSIVVYTAARRSLHFFANERHKTSAFLSGRAILIRASAQATVGSAAFCIVSSGTGTFPLRGGFSFSVTGIFIVASVECLAYKLLSLPTSSPVCLCRGSKDERVALSAQSNLFMVLWTVYVVGFGIAFVFLDYYGKMSSHWQMFFNVLLVSWKAVLPLFIPLICDAWAGKGRISPVFLALLSNSCHMFWTLLATLCFPSMDPGAFAVYLVSDVISAFLMGAKGTQLYWEIKLKLETFAKRKLGYNNHADDDGDGEVQSKIWHDRSYYTAIYVMNEISEILIPFHVLAILFLARDTANWKSAPGVFKSFHYCMIMAAVDMVQLTTTALVYFFKNNVHYGKKGESYRRDIFRPISYVFSKHCHLPLLICIATFLPAMGLLPKHSGISIGEE